MLSKWSKKYEHYKELRKRKKKIPNAAVVITMMASVILAVWQIPTATATSLEEIKVSSEISAPVDQVWNIVSDVDDETKYWPTFKSIKNINKKNNITEREVTIVTSPQGDFETSVRDLKDSYRPNLTIYIKYEIE